MMLNRFICQTILLGPELQQKIEGTRIAIIGVGGIGTHAALHAAQSGIGNILLIDADKLEDSNLSRCALFEESDIGQNKAVAATKRLENQGVVVQARTEFLAPQNAEELLKSVDFVLDASDNYGARETIANYCESAGKPWIYAGAVRSEAMVSTLLPGVKPAFKDWATTKEFEQPPCSQMGVLPAAVSLAATVQDAELLNLIAGTPALVGKLFYGDLKNGQFVVSVLKPKKQA